VTLTDRQFDPHRDWFSQHQRAWTAALTRWAGQPDVHALEIGAFEGRSACWLCDHVLTGPGSTLTCVDPWGSEWAGEKEEARFDLNTAPLPVEKIKGTSRIVLPRLAVEGRLFDFAYVDGDHRASECLWDLVLIWHLLLPGGLLIVDDYLWTDPSVPIPPRPAIDGFVAAYRDQIRHVSQSQCGQVFLWK
jgi:predicted O-methyltransferase YrrM